MTNFFCLHDQAAGGELGVALESVGGDFGVVGGPVVGGKGDAPEFGGGFQEFDANFGFGFGGGSDVGYLDELFFESFGVAAKDFLAEFDTHGQQEQCSVGVDVDGEGVFGNVLFIEASGNDENGKAEKDALSAAAIGRGSVVRGKVGHGGMARE
jgi:hypothetical protein